MSESLLALGPIRDSIAAKLMAVAAIFKPAQLVAAVARSASRLASGRAVPAPAPVERLGQ